MELPLKEIGHRAWAKRLLEEPYHVRLEKAVRRLLDNADEAKELFLVAPQDMLAVRNVINGKPKPYDREDLDVTLKLLFDGLEHSIEPSGRAVSAIQAIKEIVAAEVEYALANVGAPIAR